MQLDHIVIVSLDANNIKKVAPNKHAGHNTTPCFPHYTFTSSITLLPTIANSQLIPWHLI